MRIFHCVLLGLLVSVTLGLLLCWGSSFFLTQEEPKAVIEDAHRVLDGLVPEQAYTVDFLVRNRGETHLRVIGLPAFCCGQCNCDFLIRTTLPLAITPGGSDFVSFTLKVHDNADTFHRSASLFVEENGIREVDVSVQGKVVRSVRP